MTKQIKIVASREVSGCDTLFIEAASYQGSAPFGGAFQVWDLDHCCSTDPETGQMTSMSCASGRTTRPRSP